MAEFSEYARLVLAGFSDDSNPERRRMDRALKAHDFYQGDFEKYSARPRTGIYQSARYQRTSMLMRRVVEALTKHLYATGPARSLPDDEAASLWLSAQYAREGVDGLVQEGDRLACVGDVCAIQVVGTGDPEKPIRYSVWPAHQVIVWESEDDPCRPEAVATIDCYDQRRRLKLWTAESYQEFQTNKGDGTTGGTAYYPVGPAEENYFGVIPFAFVHFNPPNVCFWSGGPGDHLAEANDYLNYFLTEIGDSVRYCLKPILKMFGVRDGWSPIAPGQPGDIWTIPAAFIDASGNGIPPQADYLQPDPSFIEAGWADLQSYVDHTLEMNNCPPAEVRMEQAGAASGVSLLMEQLPLVIRATGRQRDFLRYERDLCRVSLAVGAAELAQLGRPDASLRPGLADTLTLRWPSMIPNIPGASAEQDLEDAAALASGQTSRVMIAMRKFNMTRDEAIAHLQQVADDLAEEAAIGLPSATPQPQAPTDPEADPEPEPDEKVKTDG